MGATRPHNPAVWGELGGASAPSRQRTKTTTKIRPQTQKFGQVLISAALPPHRLRRKPLTETPRHGEKLSTGTPTSSSASAPHSDDTTETPRNPILQSAEPIFALAGFKGVLNAIKYQEFAGLSDSFPSSRSFKFSPLGRVASSRGRQQP
jgi:hypothetical protein